MTRTQFLRLTQERLMKRRNFLRQALAGDDRLAAAQDDTVGDEVDAALAGEHAELRSQLAETESRELAQIDRALEKIHGGQYGRCETCEKAISPTRLKYLPYAAECINCARREERREAAPRAGGVNRIAAFTQDDSEVEGAEIEIG